MLHLLGHNHQQLCQHRNMFVLFSQNKKILLIQSNHLLKKKESNRNIRLTNMLDVSFSKPIKKLEAQNITKKDGYGLKTMEKEGLTVK